MRHAVLGAGGVGAFLGAALARVGRDVLLLMREESLVVDDGVVHVESALLGDFDADVPAAATLDRDVDALWVTTKATQLAGAVERVRATDAVVVPLLNGLEHVGLLRERFDTVLPASIAVESERVAPGVVRQLSGFAIAQLSPELAAQTLRQELDDAGLDVSIGQSEADVLWRKLSFLAPIALTTTLRGSALGGVDRRPGLARAARALRPRGRCNRQRRRASRSTPTRSSPASRACRRSYGRRCRRTGRRAGRPRSTRSAARSSGPPPVTASTRP